jgi:hypothetical protein
LQHCYFKFTTAHKTPVNDDLHSKKNTSQFSNIEIFISSFDSAQVVTQLMPSCDTINNKNAQEDMTNGVEVYTGLIFESIENAKKTNSTFAGYPVRQSSTRSMKDGEFLCFQPGSYTKDNIK